MDDLMEYYAIEEIKKPKEGYVACMNRWWALNKDNKVMMWNKMSLQCNKNKKIAENFPKGTGDVVFIEVAYIPLEYYI